MLKQFLIFSIAGHGWAKTVLVESTPLRKSGIEATPAFVTISGEEIENKKIFTISDLLNGVPGLTVVRSGGYGQSTSVFVRGARSEDTLVMLDGVEINDPMSPGNGFDFSTLSLENIEMIEIYRGPQGVKFGQGAMGGVINIVTKSAKREGNLLESQVGSYETMRLGLARWGGSDVARYSVGISRHNSGGFS
ncbi:MAG: TonB-dependent receptor plug domain-containing protein, partial [Bdellovibrionaceae bacterium]|nr:TonB-dependent receptor plug domain-containing protein [Pseudobdellovibrionaceae bacterium]